MDRGRFAHLTDTLSEFVNQSEKPVRFSRNQSSYHSRDPLPLPQTQFQLIDPHLTISHVISAHAHFLLLAASLGRRLTRRGFVIGSFLQLVESVHLPLAPLLPVSNSHLLRPCPIAPVVLPLRPFVVFRPKCH